MHMYNALVRNHKYMYMYIVATITTALGSPPAVCTCGYTFMHNTPYDPVWGARTCDISIVKGVGALGEKGACKHFFKCRKCRPVYGCVGDNRGDKRDGRAGLVHLATRHHRLVILQRDTRMPTPKRKSCCSDSMYRRCFSCVGSLACPRALRQAEA